MLPLLLEPSTYRSVNQDLINFSEAMLIDHYFLHGIVEGRTSNSLIHRSNFINLIDKSESSLEIGPFASPLLQGDNVYYFDVLDVDALRERAIAYGISTVNIPNKIHFVGNNLNSISRTFHSILSSHVIEHQPDFLTHLNSIESLLIDDGRYFLCIPDKRFCFDHNFAESSIADILEAFYEKRKVHTLKSIIEHRCLTTHNDPIMYWKNIGTKLWPNKLSKNNVINSISEFNESAGSYIDVHSFFFTPTSFLNIMEMLFEMNLVNLQVERIYPTKYNQNEFWAILKNGDIQDVDPFISNLKNLHT